MARRVTCSKSAYFTFSVTVRPRSPASRSRRATRTLWSRSWGRSASSPERSRSKVSSAPTDFASSSGTTGRGSSPRASARMWAPCDPNLSTSTCSGKRARSPTVAMPSARSACSVTRPTPQRRETGSGARNSAVVPGGTQTRPSGLPRSEAIFAAILQSAIPAETTSPVPARTSRFTAAAMASGAPCSARLAVTSRKASSRESGSTSGV